MTKGKFKVGDRVVVIREEDYVAPLAKVGMVGTVLYDQGSFSDSNVGIHFGEVLDVGDESEHIRRTFQKLYYVCPSNLALAAKPFDHDMETDI